MSVIGAQSAVPIVQPRYRCRNCRKWFEKAKWTVTCCVVHDRGDCCHAFEVEVTKRGWTKRVSR